MASKTKTTYLLNPFDRKKAASGELCVMVASSVEPTTGTVTPTQNSIANITNSSGTWGDEPNFKGAGICIFRAPNNFILIVDNTTYTFNERGEAANIETKGWHLLMGQIDETAQATGNAVVIKTKTVIKRNINATPVEDVQQAGESPLFDGDGEGGTSGSDTGNDDPEPEPDPGREIDPGAGRVIDDIATISDEVEMTDATDGNTVVVDSLNARDQFAMQALGELLGHIPDPSVLGENERNHFCNSAYEWAANMMTAAAKARATIKYVKEGTEEEVYDSGVTLNNNTEKLLNNIAAAIDNISISGGGGGGDDSSPSGGTDVSGIINALKSSSDISSVSGALAALRTVINNFTNASGMAGIKIGSWQPLSLSAANAGLGGTDDHRFMVDCNYNFPNRDVLGNTPYTYNNSDTSKRLDSFFVFNIGKVPGYTNLLDVAYGVLDTAGTYQGGFSATDLKPFILALFKAIGVIVGYNPDSDLNNHMQAYIDNRIRALINGAKVTLPSNPSGDYMIEFPNANPQNS